MQTFLAYISFVKSIDCLDYRRHGNQRSEARGIYGILTGFKNTGHSKAQQEFLLRRYSNHPAVLMWKGYEKQLALYHDIAIALWIKKKYNNNMTPLFYKCSSDDLGRSHSSNYSVIQHKLGNPYWLTEEFCSRHRSNLLRKKPEFYKKYGWSEPNNLPYLWPTKEKNYG
jgi:hypothetical protein